MVDYAVALPTKEERQRCAETIISIMDRMNAQNRRTLITWKSSGIIWH